MTDYIFDIDGTLANITHRRHFVQKKPKNWEAFNKAMVYDTVVEEVKQVLLDLNKPVEFGFHEEQGTYTKPANRIILCSGRGEEYRKQTLGWLQSNGIPFDALYMRPAKDHRKDSIVKSELLDKIRQDGYDPKVVFDDRNQVVDMWRERGLVCCQVAPGDF